VVIKNPVIINLRDLQDKDIYKLSFL